jgi:WD40 repeat protein
MTGNLRVPLLNLSYAAYLRVSELLSQALDVEPKRRPAWLADLEQSDPESAPMLRDLLAVEREGQQSFLDTAAGLRQHLAGTEYQDPALIGKTFGPYRVLSLIGHGGMGSVWLAERIDGLFARKVALKLINAALMNPVTKERLGREREILASLDHPNIAKLFDAGFAEDGQPYLALEYVAGVTLTTYCDQRRLSIPERLELFRQVFSAVQYAHAHLVVHRDLKPANILVTDESQVRLLDFGIAKLLAAGEAPETELTRLGGRTMTPAYASPEQISGASITTAADVYALGVMLYEILTGGRPYRLKRDSRGALEEAILNADPVPPSRFVISPEAARARRTVPAKLAKLLRGEIDTIVMKALKKLPGERYGTVEVFSEDVGRYLRGDVVLAQRDTFAYRTVKFARRNWIALTVAGVLFLTLAGGLAATTYEARVAAAERDSARQAQMRSLTQTAAARLANADVTGAMGIILGVLQQQGAGGSRAAEVLSRFQEARAADLQILGIAGHADRVFFAAFSPDGRRFVTASWDKTARVWDVETGRQVLLLNGHAGRVYSAAFSPDGQRIATASEDGTARIWSALTGQEILRLNGHLDAVQFAAFSPDGRRLVTTSVDKTARIWDAETGNELLRMTGHTEPVVSAMFSPDGRRLVTASFDKTARIWDAMTGRQLLLLQGHTERVYCASFSPDGRRLATASFDKTARIWDAATGQQILALRGHADVVDSALFSPDGHRLATASWDRTARIWDADTGQQLLLLSGHADPVYSVAFSPDGRRLVTASLDKTARLWDVATDHELALLRGHTEPVISAAYSPDGGRIATASWDRTARVWDVATGVTVLTLSGHAAEVNGAAFSPDGRRLVTASDDRTARVWDSTTGRLELTLSGHTLRVLAASFSPDGRRIVTTSNDKTARLWDAATGRETLSLRGHTDGVPAAAFSPDGQRLVTASVDRTARIWDTTTGQQVLVLTGHTDGVYGAAFSPDGRRIVTTSADKTARIWDAATGREVLVLSGHGMSLGFAAFSPDGGHIVTASDDTTARIWDAATGQQLRLISGHPVSVNAAVFSPDGRRLVTASDDKTVRIWDAGAPALEDQIRWAEAAQFDPLSAPLRFQLGMPTPGDVRHWPGDASQCDESAAAPYDAERRARGVMPGFVVADVALSACAEDHPGLAKSSQVAYERARALTASGRYSAARHWLEEAVAGGYRAAQIDLARLLTDPTAAMQDVPRAISLYERAWKDGVPIAAFELGALYEHGLRADDPGEYALAPDDARASVWYRRGGEAGEPNALAHLAEKSDAAALANAAGAGRRELLLEAFTYYAAAAERARREDWPDETWAYWRYRRASLARVLERAGMMHEVADAYRRIAAP